MELQPIDAVDRISREDFREFYLKTNRPVVIRKLADDWPARKKWSLSHMKERLGRHTVPLYRTGAIDPGARPNSPVTEMKFADYIDLIEAGPTDLRIFLLNAFRHEPSLLEDYRAPDLMDRFQKRFPMLFFGSRGSWVFLHFDIDLSPVFHTQFHGRKRAVLFAPEYSVPLYKIPFSVRSFMDLNVEQPDYGKYPALRHVRGWEATLEHGDTLFMPSGFWHHMRYLENGFALSQRALGNLTTHLKFVRNILVAHQMEAAARKIGGQSWMEYKDRLAFRRAERFLRSADA